LGSVVTVTDAAGEIEEVRGYDPFGKPRDGDWADRTPPIIGSAITDRGFTDHEHLDESQLIHMNGRAYDYNLGRFLSVDPIIQAPGNSQSLNPYSYIMNNPLAGTDPSGYCSAPKAAKMTGQRALPPQLLRPPKQAADS
jgi:RHS repeat-associated protein